MSSPNTEACIAELGPKPPAPGGMDYMIKLQACLEKKGGILGGVGGNSTKFWSSLPLPGAGTTLATPKGGALTSINPQKVGTPITGGINFENAGAFSPLEAGNCQCDDKKCYYYAPFYAKYGEQAGYGPARKSTAVLWGDKVSACERLVAEHEMESYKFDQASSRMAYAMRSPNAARFSSSQNGTNWTCTVIFSYLKEKSFPKNRFLNLPPPWPKNTLNILNVSDIPTAPSVIVTGNCMCFIQE